MWRGGVLGAKYSESSGAVNGVEAGQVEVHVVIYLIGIGSTTSLKLLNVEIAIGIETIPKIGPPSIHPLIQQFLELWRQDIAEESEEAY